MTELGHPGADDRSRP